MSMAAQPNVPEDDATWAPLPPSFPLPPGGIRVFLLHADKFGLSSADTAILSSAERQRAAAFRTAALQNLYAAAHVALRRLLSACTGIAAQDLVFGANEWGKPHLIHPAGGPHFNLSHSADKVLVAISAAGPLGVDIEQIGPEVPYEIVSEVFTEEERDLLADTVLQRRADTFYQLWTRKEAVAKGIGRGLDLGLQDIAVGANLNSVRSTASLSNTLASNGPWQLLRLPPIAGFAAALAWHQS